MTNFCEPCCLLFDLDGTLVDTNSRHLQAFNAALRPYDRIVSEEFYRTRIMGFSDSDVLAALFPERPSGEMAHVMAMKEEVFRGLSSELEPVAGAVELIELATDRGWRRAVVTNAPRENAELMLRALGLFKHFDALVIGGELARGKPDPLPYRTALARLGCTHRRAVAFEDSLSGVRSATRAGIVTVGVCTGLDSDSLRNEGASLAIDDFRCLRLHSMLGCFPVEE